MARNKSKAYTLERKTYYLDGDLYSMLRKNGISRMDIEKEYANMKLLTPNINITYNHAAYNALCKKIGRIL